MTPATVTTAASVRRNLTALAQQGDAEDDREDRRRRHDEHRQHRPDLGDREEEEHRDDGLQQPGRHEEQRWRGAVPAQSSVRVASGLATRDSTAPSISMPRAWLSSIIVAVGLP